ncbi:TonB-dependent receptor [Methylocystis parvus]|uniref:TonB-dependent receptor n=1 Tax=Methylocystis parvus TaxID=134 RepID=UPI0003774216|nr:TonB-dependent receptor [Methylocystis parvus]WBJ98526.1 TonB-dependent receptor [Methylocystis parvus OBBP]
MESSKFTLPLLNTPQSVTVIPQAVMRETGSRSLSEVLRNTPGVTIDAGENGFTASNNFRLRGFNATSDIFIDNSRDNGNYTRDMFNTERVEVFKGAAADNGRGSAGGYVNLVTKAPMLANFVSGETWYGWDHYNSESRKRGTIDANYVVAPNTAIRLNAMVENSGVPGREIALNRPWGVAPSISFGLGADLRATFIYEHQERRDLPDWGVPAASVANMVRSDPIAMMAPRDTFYGLRRDFDNVDANSAEARLAYDILPNVTISNQTRWSQVRRFANYTLPGAPAGGAPPAYVAATGMVTTQNQSYDRTTATLTNLTNLSAKFDTGPFRHELSTGIDYSLERSFSYRFNDTQGSTFIFSPDPDRFQTPAIPLNTNKLGAETIAGYAYDSIHLHPQWILTGGVRVEGYHLAIGMKDLAGLPTGNYDGYTNSATTVGGKVGVVYKPIEKASLYGAVGWSNEPVGANFLNSADISRGDDRAVVTLVPGSQPIRMVNYEIGGKWDAFDGRLSTTLALFHTVKTVPITGCFGNPPGLPGAGCIGGAAQPITLKGYGDQIAQGVEFGVSGNVTDNWRMFGGFLIMRTEQKHAFYLDWFRMAASPGDYPVFAPGVDAPAAFLNGFYRRGTSGDELAFAPNVTGNLWTTYHLPETPVTLGGGLNYSSESWAGRQDYGDRIVPNGRFGKLPGYFIVNLMSSFELYKDVVLSLNIDNVANTKYAISTNYGAQRVILGTPRAYRFSVSFRF